MALAVVAGLWLLVFVPSWFKRSQERERGIVLRPSTPSKSRQKVQRRPSVDNFSRLARDYAEAVEAEDASPIDVRAWQRTELPEPRLHQGTLEVVEIAEVVSLDNARNEVSAKRLEQHELDEILRRRRANG